MAEKCEVTRLLSGTRSVVSPPLRSSWITETNLSEPFSRAVPMLGEDILFTRSRDVVFV